MSAQDFGANDWLVDEMYEQFLTDPSSVDPSWIEYFRTNKPSSASSQSGAVGSSHQSVSKGVPPVPKAQQHTPVQVTPAAVTLAEALRAIPE